MMAEAEKVSELHQEVKNNLINEDFEKVKNWQKDAYHKQMMGGFKETKEADEGFKKAQKPWAKKLKEVSQTICNPNRNITYMLSYLLCLVSWKLPRNHTTWPAKRRSWHPQERPTVRQKQSQQTSRRNFKRKWKSVSWIHKG